LIRLAKTGMTPSPWFQEFYGNLYLQIISMTSAVSAFSAVNIFVDKAGNI
jgi:hypothetical protein